MPGPRNVLGSSNSTTYSGGKMKVIDPNGMSYLRHKYEKITLSSDGADISTASKWGISDITRSGNTTDFTLSLAAPEAGCEKTIMNRTTAASTLYTSIDVDSSGLGIRVNESSDGRYVKFSSLGTRFQSITLIGLTSLLWGVKCINSTIGVWNAATGIRVTTASSG